MKNILVSVVCTAYNHEKYIRKALDGFVMQKTDFGFEVIVHDDASTDKTSSIIKEYEKKYDFIKPIYETENQYSKQDGSIRQCIIPKLTGKYIAYCEGDDYWMDENKLQILVDYMENNPDCSMCCHGYYNINANTGERISINRLLEKDGDISMRNAIMYRNQPQIASQIFRRECIVNQPSIFLDRGIGDYTSLLYSATLGKIHYIDKIMSCHRCNSDGSWSVRIYNNPTKRKKHFDQMISFLDDFNVYTNKKYESDIIERRNWYLFEGYMAIHDYKNMLKSSLFKSQTAKRKCFIMVGCVFPNIASYIYDKKMISNLN